MPQVEDTTEMTLRMLDEVLAVPFEYEVKRNGLVCLQETSLARHQRLRAVIALVSASALPTSALFTNVRMGMAFHVEPQKFVSDAFERLYALPG